MHGAQPLRQTISLVSQPAFRGNTRRGSRRRNPPNLLLFMVQKWEVADMQYCSCLQSRGESSSTSYTASFSLSRLHCDNLTASQPELYGHICLSLRDILIKELGRRGCHQPQVGLPRNRKLIDEAAKYQLGRGDVAGVQLPHPHATPT